MRIGCLSATLLMSASVCAGDCVLISDIAGKATACAWRPMSYETTDGIRGTMLYAQWGLPPCQKFELPLPVRGKHRIFLGLAGARFPLETAPFRMLVRLAREPAPVKMDAVAETAEAGWWAQLCEYEWKCVDLDHDTLVVENVVGSRAALAWVRLVPADEIPDLGHPSCPISATNDAYQPFDSIGELFSPLMRFENSPVRRVFYCVGQGASTFVVPSRIAESNDYRVGSAYENEYALRCAKSFDWVHREHPDILRKMVDFTHSIGLEYHVSFRTGCWVDMMRFPDRGNFADPCDEARGIRRPENYCRLWDGTPVARFSYAAEEVQDFFLRFYREMLIDGVDGLNLIWTRAMPAMLFEPAFRARFKSAYGEALTKEGDPRVVDLRCEILTGFLRRVREIVGKRHLSMIVFPDETINRGFGLDIVRLAKEGIVDEFIVSGVLGEANHRECEKTVDLGFFRRACTGTDSTFSRCLLWWDVKAIEESCKAGAAGAVIWDLAANQPWRRWEEFRMFTDRDGSRMEKWKVENPWTDRIHTFKTLCGFDAAVYPWHVAY